MFDAWVAGGVGGVGSVAVTFYAAVSRRRAMSLRPLLENSVFACAPGSSLFLCTTSFQNGCLVFLNDERKNCWANKPAAPAVVIIPRTCLTPHARAAPRNVSKRIFLELTGAPENRRGPFIRLDRSGGWICPLRPAGHAITTRWNRREAWKEHFCRLCGW